MTLKELKRAQKEFAIEKVGRLRHIKEMVKIKKTNVLDTYLCPLCSTLVTEGQHQ